MLKIIIADDEKTTRESLKEYVKWDTLGIGNVEIAKNGLIALELAEISKPDILLTDVRMPKMDGIELATKIRELYPDCRIIFISGYSDKEYLKSAIHLKAVSYIEKPLDLAEVEAVVSQAISACIEDEEKKKDTERLKNNLSQSRPFIRQEITLDLIKGNTDRNNLLKKLDDPFLKLPETGLFNVCCIKLNWKSDVDDKTKSNLRHTILELFLSNELFDPAANIAGITPEDTIALIVSGTAAESLNSTKLPAAILERLHELSEGYFSSSMGIGTAVKMMSALAQSYSQALTSLNMQFYTGSNKIYHYGSIFQKDFKPDRNLFANFKDFLKKDDRKGAADLVSGLTKSVRITADQEIDHIKNIYFNLLLLIFEAARDRNLIEPADENEKTYIWQEINGIQSLSELSEYIGSNISAVFSRFDNSDNINRKAYEIMKYIKENFCNKELSIQSIANNVHFSQTYLCSFFKKSTGMTLNEYITDVRIGKAKELLQDGSTKLYEVAITIGFTDCNYFSTLFKKVVGCSSSEYREKYRL